jgi:hypothetical protein
MSILSKYNSSQATTNAVSDASKNTTKYEDAILKQGSSVLKQATSPTAPSGLAPIGGAQDYTEQVFKETVQ